MSKKVDLLYTKEKRRGGLELDPLKLDADNGSQQSAISEKEDDSSTLKKISKH